MKIIENDRMIRVDRKRKNEIIIHLDGENDKTLCGVKKDWSVKVSNRGFNCKTCLVINKSKEGK